MHWVNTMGFITHCLKRTGLELLRSLLRLLCVGWLSVSGAWAQNASIELTELKAVRDNGSLMLNAQLALELNVIVCSWDCGVFVQCYAADVPLWMCVALDHHCFSVL